MSISHWFVVGVNFLWCRYVSVFDTNATPAVEGRQAHSYQPLKHLKSADDGYAQPKWHGSTQCLKELKNGGILFNLCDQFSVLVRVKDIDLYVIVCQVFQCLIEYFMTMPPTYDSLISMAVGMLIEFVFQ